VTTPDGGPRTRLSRASKLTLSAALALLLIAGAVALVLYLRHRSKPAPTVAGWRGTVATLAGDGAPGDQDNAQAHHARFHDPFGVAVDKLGNVYLTDAGASNRVRKLTPGGGVSTLAGGAEGHADGAGAAASFNTPSALAVDEAGNLYAADTGNNRVRKITPEGVVSTLAGDGTRGFRDGPAAAARFDAPVGVAVGRDGTVFVADTYNDRVRAVMPAGEVKTIAGGDRPGYADGAGTNGALFDTPCAVAFAADGSLVVADTGNGRLRRIAPDGQVTTINFGSAERPDSRLAAPAGLAATHDGFLYVTELEGGRVWQLAPDNRLHLVAGLGAGYAEGDGHASARFNRPAGVAVDRAGALYVADGANYLVRKITHASPEEIARAASAAQQSQQPAAGDGAGASPGATSNSHTSDPAAAPVEIPRLGAATLGVEKLPWPLDPQDRPHEVTATMGEVRGAYDTADQRHHLHSGIDIFGGLGATVRAVFDDKVSGPLPAWGFNELHEGLRAGLFAYIHIKVGRGERDEPFDDPRFVFVRDERQKIARVRVRRGTRFRAGDKLGTVNRLYHVHLNFGPPQTELNPLALPFVGFSDTRPPRINPGGIHLFDESGRRLEERRDGRTVVGRGRVRVVVDALDQVDGNAARRRLGLYRLGYGLLGADGRPAAGFGGPRVQLVFDRLPPGRDAVKLAYADASGITVYGSSETRFFYEVTNDVRHGAARPGFWDTTRLPAGDYTLRVFAADFAGNEAAENRDLAVRIE
jgi:DNA-binding beta-propeller fold protein YncE